MITETCHQIDKEFSSRCSVCVLIDSAAVLHKFMAHHLIRKSVKITSDFSVNKENKESTNDRKCS